MTHRPPSCARHPPEPRHPVTPQPHTGQDAPGATSSAQGLSPAEALSPFNLCAALARLWLIPAPTSSTGVTSWEPAALGWAGGSGRGREVTMTPPTSSCPTASPPAPPGTSCAPYGKSLGEKTPGGGIREEIRRAGGTAGGRLPSQLTLAECEQSPRGYPRSTRSTHTPVSVCPCPCVCPCV